MDNQKNQIVEFVPFKEQAKIFTSKKRIIIAIAGIQGGKTISGIYWSQLQIQENPDKNGLICGLSHDQLSNVIIDKFFNTFPQYKKFFVKKEKTLFLPTGGRVFFRPLEDPKYIEGITAHWAWIDEGDLISYRAYINVRGRLGSTGGKLLITSSLTDGGWLGEYAEKMAEAQDIDIITWKSIDNPGFSREEWEALKRELDPLLFKRRYEAQYSKYSGRVYSFFDFEKHVRDRFEQGEVGEKYFIGFDWGWNDPTVIVVVALTNLKNIYVMEDFSLSKMPLELIKKIIFEMRKRYRISAYYADPENKQFIEEVKKAAMIEIIPGVRDLFTGINKIRNLIYQNRFFVMSKCKNVLRELKNYRYVESLKGLTEEPEDDNNHCLDAIRYIISTYPIPEKHIVEKAAPELSPFWLRRTALYKKLIDREKLKVYTDYYGDDNIFFE